MINIAEIFSALANSRAVNRLCSSAESSATPLGSVGNTDFPIPANFKSDIKLLENNFNLSPQEYVTSNIMGMFSDTDENHYDNFKNWCIDNKIKELYNIDYQDIKNSSGYIKLGDLIYTENREDFLMKLSNFKNIIGYKII